MIEMIAYWAGWIGAAALGVLAWANLVESVAEGKALLAAFWSPMAFGWLIVVGIHYTEKWWG